MDMNSYAIEALARTHLAELRAAAEHHDLARAATGPGRPLRVTLGLMLIRIGTWALGSAHRPLAPRLS
jgi:hypothetical protein